MRLLTLEQSKESDVKAQNVFTLTLLASQKCQYRQHVEIKRGKSFDMFSALFSTFKYHRTIKKYQLISLKIERCWCKSNSSLLQFDTAPWYSYP